MQEWEATSTDLKNFIFNSNRILILLEIRIFVEDKSIWLLKNIFLHFLVLVILLVFTIMLIIFLALSIAFSIKAAKRHHQLLRA